MNLLGTNIQHIRADYKSATGKSCQHFFCPILHVDENVPLTKGHIVPESLGGKSRVLQRADVDNGFGSFFEAEAADAIRHGLDHHPLRTVLDGDPEAMKKIARRFRLRVHLEGTDEFLDASIRNIDGKPALQVSTEKLSEVPGQRTNSDARMGLLTLDLDARSSILVTALRTSHLSWFSICGYRYVFDNEGILVATVLRGFYEDFIRPRHRPHRTKKGSLISQQVKDEVNEHCFQFANFIRPLQKPEVERLSDELRRGTPDTGCFIALWDGPLWYGRISIVKLGNQHFGVMTPTITDARGWALLDLAANLELETSFARFDPNEGGYCLDPPNQRTIWPNAQIENDSTPAISIRQAAQIVLESGRMNRAGAAGSTSPGHAFTPNATSM